MNLTYFYIFYFFVHLSPQIHYPWMSCHVFLIKVIPKYNAGKIFDSWHNEMSMVCIVYTSIPFKVCTANIQHYIGGQKASAIR